MQLGLIFPVSPVADSNIIVQKTTEENTYKITQRYAELSNGSYITWTAKKY